VLDLTSSPLAAGAKLTIRSGELDGRLPLAEALDAAAKSVDSRRGESYELALDGAGRAEVSVGSVAALNRLRSVIDSSPPSAVAGVRVLRDSARVATRAVHECFYGEKWAPEDRLSVIRAAASFGVNAYVYGPSADRRTGGLWRELYGGAEREALTDFARRARALGIEPIWRVSPAAPLEPDCAIRIADEAEMAALVAKIDHVLGLGFERVLIAFDDLTAGLDDDAAGVFGGAAHPLAAAHASVIRAVGERVGHSRLIACPLHYWGVDTSTYRREFGAGFPAEVPVCWTGPAVISDEIDSAGSAAVADELGHPLWLWDNYPVNDWDMEGISALPLHAQPGLDNLVRPRRLPLAALQGRDPRLVDGVAAMGSNLAIGPWTGLPGALTLCDFAWSGGAYRPERSWSVAVGLLGVDADALAVLTDAAGPGSGSPSRRPSAFAAACARVFSADDDANLDMALIQLESVVAVHVQALTALRGNPNRLTAELHPWLMELGRQCQFARLACLALRASVTEASELAKELSGALARPSLVSVASGMGRALAEYARGLVAGGTPDIDLPNSDSFGH